MDISDNGFIRLSNKLAECKIALWGGNVVSYRPKGEEHDVFWLGELNKFDNVQAIRGGVPVCWPRFAEETLNRQSSPSRFCQTFKLEFEERCG